MGKNGQPTQLQETNLQPEWAYKQRTIAASKTKTKNKKQRFLATDIPADNTRLDSSAYDSVGELIEPKCLKILNNKNKLEKNVNAEENPIVLGKNANNDFYGQKQLQCSHYKSLQPDIQQSKTEIIAKILKETNKYRRMHYSHPLVLNEELMNYAQEWADQIALVNRLETRPKTIYGENVMRCEKGEFNIKRLMRLWYQEKYYYEYGQPKFSPYTGHFTQMIWRGSQELGVGIVIDKRYVWIVCNYNPPGNIRGQYAQNVKRRKLMLSSDSSESESSESDLTKKNNVLKKAQNKSTVLRQKCERNRVSRI